MQKMIFPSVLACVIVMSLAAAGDVRARETPAPISSEMRAFSAEPAAPAAEPTPEADASPAPAGNDLKDDVEEVRAVTGEAKDDMEKREPEAARFRADFKAMRESGRENMILGDIDPIRELIVGAGLTCDKLDGGYFNVDKKTTGSRIVHKECGRLWCDDQAHSYRMFYHGEYSKDEKTSYLDSTKVEPWSKTPPLCDAD